MVKHRKKPKRNPLVNFLPYEIILEILLRLPVKSLVRFRCVSKSWLSLITDPQFVKNHLSLSTSDDGLEKWRIILRYPFHTLKSCSLYSIFHEPYGYSVDLDYPMKEFRNEIEIIGSCNGLVSFCIKEKKKENCLFLWNPSTRESKELPPAIQEFSPFSTYAFGYNEIVDDYKVVKLVILKFVKPQIEVFSLRTDSWRRIEDFPFEIDSIEAGKLVKGSLNWGVDRSSDNSWVIVSFDLAEEKFGEVPQPDYGGGEFNPLLRVLEGCLCVLCDKAGLCVDVWMMKEYGLKESWTKLVTVPYSTQLKSLQFPRSLCFLKYGGILMYFGRTLVLFDLEEKTFKYPLVYGVQDCHEADIYLESLVSPNAYRGTGFDLNN